MGMGTGWNGNSTLGNLMGTGMGQIIKVGIGTGDRPNGNRIYENERESEFGMLKAIPAHL